MSKNKNKLCLQGDGLNNSVPSWPLRAIWIAQGSEQGEPGNCPFALVSEERNQKQPWGRKGDLPKDKLEDSLTSNHKMLEPAPRWLTGGTDRLTPGNAPEGLSQKEGYFSWGTVPTA